MARGDSSILHGHTTVGLPGRLIYPKGGTPPWNDTPGPCLGLTTSGLPVTILSLLLMYKPYGDANGSIKEIRLGMVWQSSRVAPERISWNVIPRRFLGHYNSRTRAY